MPKMNLELTISGLEPMKRIASLLAEHYESLAPELQEAIGELFAEERECWDLEYSRSIGMNPSEVWVIVDGEVTTGVTAIYPNHNEILIWQKGIRKFSSLDIVSKATAERICGVGVK